MLKTFRGGIHPDDAKRATAAKAIVSGVVPERVIIPMRQHIGAPCKPIVQVGDAVKKGQKIGEGEGFVSAPIHASISGKVVEIANKPHPVFGSCQAVVIESDGQDEWLEGLPTQRDWQSLSANDLKNMIREAGLVGMGGAAFPTHVKLSPPADKKIDLVILNGAECEPYLTADHRLMVERAADVIAGIQIIRKILGVEQCRIGIENNKPDAIQEMQQACAKVPGIEVEVLQCKYPQGAEKNLIYAVSGRAVPSGGLPMDVGVVVQNVGTAIAVYEAVTMGKPLIERVVTVTGECITNPSNLVLRVGTTFVEAIAMCGGLSCTPGKVIMGGPMMGMAQQLLDVPVVKGTSGILTLTPEQVQPKPEGPCIHCGRCVNACPMGLVPSMFSILGEKGLYVEAKEQYNVLDCVECGSCVFACPAKRNIVHYVKLIKARNAAMKK